MVLTLLLGSCGILGVPLTLWERKQVCARGLPWQLVVLFSYCGVSLLLPQNITSRSCEVPWATSAVCWDVVSDRDLILIARSDILQSLLLCSQGLIPGLGLTPSYSCKCGCAGAESLPKLASLSPTPA